MCNHQRLRPACAYAQSDQSLCLSLEYSLTVKLLTEHNLEFLSLKGGCTGSSESTHAKMPSCWKSHVMAHMYFYVYRDIKLNMAIFSQIFVKSDHFFPQFMTLVICSFFCISSVETQNLVALIFTKTTFCQRGNTKRMAQILSNSRSSRPIRTPLKSINHASKYCIYER